MAPPRARLQHHPFLAGEGGGWHLQPQTTGAQAALAVHVAPWLRNNPFLMLVSELSPAWPMMARSYLCKLCG